MTKAWSLVDKGLTWNVEKRDKIRFWKDAWVSLIRKLEDFLLVNFPKETQNKSILAYVTPQGNGIGMPLKTSY